MKVVITGGAGFIGSNAASRALRRGDEVIVLDDLSRPGVAHNVAWLEPQGAFTLARVDIRDAARVQQTFDAHRDVGLVLHLAGQTAVTTSVTDPRRDFEANALGTLNVLEALRRTGAAAPLIFASTNKVYGDLEDVAVVERGGRWTFAERPLGIAETQPLDFHSPYGCSKGAADQYVRDYHRIYGLRTVVLRQSCIYGERQLGIEDQGWVAWFTIAATYGRPITIYGDGKQVRDVLFVDDLLDAFDAAARAIDVAAGRVYNIGGGPDNVLAVREVLTYLEERLGRAIPHARAETRPGDQKVFVSDIRRAAAELGWKPRIGWERGLERLAGWVAAHAPLFR